VRFALDFASEARSPNGNQSPLLSRREHEVAVLVAQGLTDRDIAEALVITEGTVGTHVSHIFDKLGIRSRARLAAWVTEHASPTRSAEI
jgi:DNA-binding NarL/FixJ family response regulator